MSRPAVEMTARYRALCNEYAVPVFHQPWWLDVACDQWLGVVVESDVGVAIWPVPLERRVGVRISRNPALTAYLGPVCLNASGAYSTDVPKAILGKLLERLPAFPVWHVAAHPAKWPIDIFSSHGFEVGARPTYFLNLADSTEENLLAAVIPNLRRKIRRGMERYTITSEPGAVHEVYALQSATLRRKGARAYHTVDDFSALVEAAYQYSAGALWTARIDGKLIGAQWSVWDERCCCNLGLARDEQSVEKFSSAALLWHAITEACRRGNQIFDFEGSSIPGIASFFAEFGSERQSYLTLQKNTSPIWRLVRRLRP